MAILRKRFNPTSADIPVALGLKTKWDAINAGKFENFIAVKEGRGWLAGIAKKVPQTGMLGTRYDGKVEDTATTGNYVTLTGRDGDVVEFRNVADLRQTEIGTGTFPYGADVYGTVDATTGIVTITDVPADGLLYLGVVSKALETWGTADKAVQVSLRSNGVTYTEVDTSDLPLLTAYSLPVGASAGASVDGVIDQAAGTITVQAVYGADITGIAATFTASANATVKVGENAQTSASTTNDFDVPVVYTVTAADGVKTKNYTVLVVVAEPKTDCLVTAYSLPVGTDGADVSGTINQTLGTIAVAAVAGTTVTALAATFTLSTGATAKVGSTTQVNGTTTNNFTNPVEYTITAEDGVTTKTYTVTVTVAS